MFYSWDYYTSSWVTRLQHNIAMSLYVAKLHWRSIVAFCQWQEIISTLGSLDSEQRISFRTSDSSCLCFSVNNFHCKTTNKRKRSVSWSLLTPASSLKQPQTCRLKNQQEEKSLKILVLPESLCMLAFSQLSTDVNILWHRFVKHR